LARLWWRGDRANPSNPLPSPPHQQVTVQFLYAVATQASASSVSGFSIDSNGSLTPLGKLLQTPDPIATFTQMPNRAIVLAAAGNNLLTLQVDPFTGALRQVASATLPPDALALRAVVNPAGTMLFTTIQQHPGLPDQAIALASFAIAPSGVLTPGQTTPLHLTAFPI
jgi:hypothetical protein